MLMGHFPTDCCFLLKNVMVWTPIGFPLSKYTIQVFIPVLFSQSAPSSWHQHFKGILASSTLSIIIFLAVINVVIEYTLATSGRKVVSTGNVAFPIVRAFMDDLNLTPSSVSDAQNLLHRCVEALSWAGMYFRADKSRSIIIVRDKSMDTTLLYATEPSATSNLTNYIPSIHLVAVKFRIINVSLTDRNSIDELQQKLVLCLNINETSFKGTQKHWILQHILISRIQWSLLIYEISIPHASSLEKKISKFISRLLNIHSSTTDISLYSSISPCPFPIDSLTSILKSSKISGNLLLRDSKDRLVSSVSPSLKSGHRKAT